MNEGERFKHGFANPRTRKLQEDKIEKFHGVYDEHGHLLMDVRKRWCDLVMDCRKTMMRLLQEGRERERGLFTGSPNLATLLTR
ncbi:hypothetical protein Y032_0280g1218 [Ancylostoma ceylanicum]|uniref:Uncharacterized protein n=1 Tax=Ancylostoma ceylanicum TaxID=53326 RepID=A0A016S7X5_9BILA|nr:hypothetical protein Y032_0280g1218 [Ancylostoma ceylanicum]